MGRRDRKVEKRIHLLREAGQRHHPVKFLDYCVFLKSVYEYVKAGVGPSYSWILFSEDLGLGHSNASWLISQGRRKMTPHSAGCIAEALDLRGESRKYLIALMEYGNVSGTQMKQEALERLLIHKRAFLTPERQLSLDFFSRWYHAAVFELVGFVDFTGDPDWLVERMCGRVTREEVEESLVLLERLQCLQRDESTGRLRRTREHVGTGPKGEGAGLVLFHKKMIDLGKVAIDTIPPAEREFGAVSLSLRSEQLEQVKVIIRDFKEKLIALTKNIDGPEGVVQVNVQMFPLTSFVRGMDDDI